MSAANHQGSNDTQEYSHSVAPDDLYTVTENMPSSVTQVHDPNYNIGAVEVENQSERIHSYLAWSIVNLLFGVLILGMIAIGFSVQVRTFLSSNQIVQARRYSQKALTCNVFATLGGLFLWGIFIYYIIATTKAKE
jgi:hypothetical protein